MEKLPWKKCEEGHKTGQRTIKTKRTSQIDQSIWISRLQRWQQQQQQHGQGNLLPFWFKDHSHLSQPIHYSTLEYLCTVCCIVIIVMVLSGIDVPKWFLSLNVALTKAGGGCFHDDHSFCGLDHVLGYCSTNTAQYRRANYTTVVHTDMWYTLYKAQRETL